MSYESLFFPHRVVSAQGGRIGFMVCKKCGAAVMLEPHNTVNMPELHWKWHQSLMPQEQVLDRPS